MAFGNLIGGKWIVIVERSPNRNPSDPRDVVGEHSFSSSGAGGIQRLMMEMFKGSTGTFITHIPYRGAGPALTETVSG